MKCRTLLCIGLLAGSLPAQQPPVKGFNLYTPEREIRLGREAAYNLEHTLPLVRVSRIDAYLAKLAILLSEQAGYSLPFRFTVFDDRKPFTAYPGELAMPLDAFGSQEPVALPGGFIFVPLSLLAAAHDEPELIFQLAHAMAHATRRHGSRRATREQLAGMVSVDVSVRTASVQLDIAGGKELASRLLGLRYARSLELEADRAAGGMVGAYSGTPGEFAAIKALAAAL
jgi:predicted Zn-dependent protease